MQVLFPISNELIIPTKNRIIIFYIVGLTNILPHYYNPMLD